MEKVLADGTIIKKARFIRTTCKYCGKLLNLEQFNNHFYWCNKACKDKFIKRSNRSHGLNKKQRKRLYEKEMMKYGSGFSNETGHQGSHK